MRNVTERWNVVVEGKTYPAIVTWKRKRTLRFSISRDGKTINISVPNNTSKEYIKQGIQKHIPGLLKRFQYEEPIGKDYVYIFGKKESYPGFHLFEEKKQQKILKDILFEYIVGKSGQIALLMGVKTPYTYKVRKMVSRYGVNNITNKTITYSTCLVHYSKEIIDSVIYHELTHDSIRDHSYKFYEKLLSFMPDYKEKHAKLKRHIYE
ncbi:MAG: M48 family metallopeptidase [Bacilli bacterium]|nr:M48 family metallopeptidase [Bacilli bacterium]